MWRQHLVARQRNIVATRWCLEFDRKSSEATRRVDQLFPHVMSSSSRPLNHSCVFCFFPTFAVQRRGFSFPAICPFQLPMRSLLAAAGVRSWCTTPTHLLCDLWTRRVHKKSPFTSWINSSPKLPIYSPLVIKHGDGVRRLILYSPPFPGPLAHLFRHDDIRLLCNEKITCSPAKTCVGDTGNREFSFFFFFLSGVVPVSRAVKNTVILYTCNTMMRWAARVFIKYPHARKTAFLHFSKIMVNKTVLHFGLEQFIQTRVVNWGFFPITFVTTIWFISSWASR